jgi:uncharacterized protein (TIGR02284 family)
MTNSTLQDATLVAELNDLLQLDHDAISAYSLAIKELHDPALKNTLNDYRGDHERHVTELTELITRYGGVPIQLSHLPTGVFKLAMQAMGAMGTDREVLLAFRTNERQARDKYARAAAMTTLPPDALEIVRRGAADEARHYDWAVQSLEALGVTEESKIGRVAKAVETVHARHADTVEAVEKKGMVGAEFARRGITEQARRRPMVAALAAVGVGVVAAALLGGRSSGRSRS